MSIEELKEEAASLGIKHNANISEGKLKEKVDQHYAAQETSGPSIASLVEDNEKSKGSVSTGTKPKLNAEMQKIIKRTKDAKKTRIIKIVDNDQRQNNHTTTCTVNCSNEYFDLGTRILPLNEPIEVAQGHIDTLKEVMITLHVKDVKTGLSAAKQRNRYSLSTEDA